MKKLILTIALFVGIAVISNAQNNTSGTTSTAKPTPVIDLSKQPGTAPVVTSTSTTEATPTPAATPAKKTNKKNCCKKKGSSCCKKKTEAIKED